MKSFIFMLAIALNTSCAFAQGVMRGSSLPKGDPPPMSLYFSKPSATAGVPDDMGFIRRWTILEPINKPNRTNNVFSEAYLKDAFERDLFPGQWTVSPKDGQKVKVGKQTLRWHRLDSNHYNVKVFRMASGLGKQLYGVIFCFYTVIHADRDLSGVRFAVGSNGASSWWLNGEKVLVLNYDRRMVMDDCVSPPLTLKRGDNVVRGMLINGPGMSDFCFRLIDQQGNPVNDITIP